MRVQVVTLFPELITQAVSHSILGRAQAAEHLSVETIDPRNFTTNKHRTADDYPFGGGAGMVMKPEPLVGAIEAAWEGEQGVETIFLTPDGEVFSQEMAEEFATKDRLVLVCGHYEGIDERVREGWITREVSIGDYVLTGGELAALVVLDATARLLPGVLGNAHSAGEESFEGGVLEYPHYTRPAEFQNRRVPDILLSGHHAEIEKWRRQKALVKTRARRPDLFEKLLPLSKTDQKLLDKADSEEAARAAETVRVTPTVSEALLESEPETAGGRAEQSKLEE
ncbi:MAG: tRNA (guanosine(37)-N1)-methyltransferase TrmD [Armatimonas sp.]